MCNKQTLFVALSRIRAVTCSLCPSPQYSTKPLRPRLTWLHSRFPLFAIIFMWIFAYTETDASRYFSHTGERRVSTRHWSCTSVVHTVETRPPPRSLQSSLLSFRDEIHWISRGKTGKVKENDWKGQRLDTDSSELESYEKRYRHCEAGQGLYHIRCMANHL